MTEGINASKLLSAKSSLTPREACGLNGYDPYFGTACESKFGVKLVHGHIYRDSRRWTTVCEKQHPHGSELSCFVGDLHPIQNTTDQYMCRGNKLALRKATAGLGFEMLGDCVCICIIIII